MSTPSLAALSFEIPSLAAALRGGLALRELHAEVLRRIGADEHRAWIKPLSSAEAAPFLTALETRRDAGLPLFGLPFALKDNIDLAGVPTTAGCAAYAYTARDSAAVVQRLLAAGAWPVGKTNLDQFATGLNGTRSPFGACRNSFDPSYVSGGSSSGSAVSVALGQVSFSLGTDTAGSGRVPAALNNIVGLKPSVGLLSTRGVVPACRSLDCVSIFALTVQDAAEVLAVAQGHDTADPYSRAAAPAADDEAAPLRVGVPARALLEFDGDTAGAASFDAALERLTSMGAQLVEIDFTPFRDAARLLYAGAWVAERYAAVGEFIAQHPDDVLPVIREIILPGRDITAVAAFRDAYRLRELRARAERELARVHCLVTPTAPRHYTLAELQADPVGANSRLGYYTNYVNLFDLCAVAVPAGLLPGGLPFGITLLAPALREDLLLRFGARLAAGLALAPGAPVQQQRSRVVAPGAAPRQQRVAAAAAAAGDAGDAPLRIAVCGAHMRGLPLNAQLLELGARFVTEARSSAAYRLYALPGGPPLRPGLVRVAADGAPVALEIWELPSRALGSLAARIPAPLGLGRIDLESGGDVLGFLCEAVATAAAHDITSHGGWRAFLETRARG